MDNQQLSLSAHNGGEESSTTIPKGSTGKKITGKRSVFLNKHNVIYMILNNKTKMFYIGSAANYANRMTHHISKLRHNSHSNKYLQHSWNKYKEECFEYYILEEIDDNKHLLEKEQYYLDLYKSYDQKIGYNICPRASRNRYGMKMPNSAKIKIGNYWRGKKWSENRKIAHKKRVTKNQGKAVLVYDKHYNLLFEFPSRSEASRELKVSIASISKQCKKGKTKCINKVNYIFRNKDIV